jgi:hypothetical protein
MTPRQRMTPRRRVIQHSAAARLRGAGHTQARIRTPTYFRRGRPRSSISSVHLPLVSRGKHPVQSTGSEQCGPGSAHELRRNSAAGRPPRATGSKRVRPGAIRDEREEARRRVKCWYRAPPQSPLVTRRTARGVSLLDRSNNGCHVHGNSGSRVNRTMLSRCCGNELAS